MSSWAKSESTAFALEMRESGDEEGGGPCDDGGER